MSLRVSSFKPLVSSLISLRAKAARRRTGSERQRVSVALEMLEDRLVLSNTTNYSELAQQFPRHSGPSTLYLNFDGWVSKGISPLWISGKSQADIQDILYRTSEVFSPFDVEVRRAFGDGAYGSSNGDSTVFIGDMTENGIG